MQRTKRGFLFVLLASLMLMGCQKKVTTVADDITAVEPEETGYLEIGAFEAKAEVDTSLEDIGYCAILVPSGFIPSDEIEGMYVSSLYPLDSSNIYYSVVSREEVGAINNDITQSDYELAVEDAYASMGEKRDIEIDSFEKGDLDGVPCVKVRSHYNIGNKDIQQLIYIVLASETHVITYTQVSDDELMYDFLQEEGNIKLVREISQA